MSQSELGVVVLANGEQARWPAGSPPKQLLEVDGVSLIGRTVFRFAELLRAEPIVITEDPLIVAEVGGMKVRRVGKTDEQLATLLAARPYWGTRRTVCLLGDVYYTDQAMTAIVECQKPIAFYGRRLASKVTGKPYGELVAMAWDADLDERVAQSLATWHDRPLLWSPYRDFAGLWDLPNGENYLLRVPPCLTEIDDLTDDFNTPQDWHTWRRLRTRQEVGQKPLRVDPTRRWEASGRESGYDLQDALSSACWLIDPKRYLEIGVDGGGSLFAVLEKAKLERVVLCDLWDPGYCDHGFAGHRHIEQALAAFHQPPASMEFLDGDSAELVPHLAGELFDLITVDGGHTENQAHLDLRNCWPLLREGGLLVLDDVGHVVYGWVLEFVLRNFMAEHHDAMLVPEKGQPWRNCALLVKTSCA